MQPGVFACGACGLTMVGFPSPPGSAVLPPTLAAPVQTYPPSAHPPGIGPTAAMPSAPPPAWNAASGYPPSPYPFASSQVVPAAPSGARWGVLIAVFAAGVLLAGAGAVIFLRGTDRSNVTPPSSAPVAAPSVAVPSPPVTPAPAASAPSVPQQVAAPRPAAISFGMAIVHYRVSVDDPDAALGQPDARYAAIRAGVLTLQMPDGQQLISDGTLAPDIRVEVDPARPGPYRVEIGVGHNVFVAVAEGASGSQAIDIDAAGVRVGRFVRVSTRASGTTVALDAALVRIPPTTP